LARTTERISNQKFRLRLRFLQKIDLPNKVGQWNNDRFVWPMPVLKNLPRNLIGQHRSPRRAVPNRAAAVVGGVEAEDVEGGGGNRL
jgi:hypothetical protein